MAMLARVIGDLLCATEADAVQVRAAVAQKLATKPVALTTVAPTVHGEGTDWHLICDVSFLLKLDADDVKGDVQAKWTAGGLKNRILPGSRVSVHLCPHTDATLTDPFGYRCTEAVFEFAEAVK